MLPRPAMLTIQKLFRFKTLPALLLVVLLAGCKPPGPKALLDGQRHLERGRVEMAIERLQVATQLMPTNAHAWNYLGIACHQGGQVSNAVVAYQRALQLDADLSEARMNLGTLWLESGRMAEAKAEFTAYHLRRPNDPEGFKQLALAELQGREFASAESHVRKALQLNDADAGAWNTLGLIQLQQRQPQAAAQSFETAVNRDERLAAARINLAVVLHQQLGSPEAALKHYRRYLEIKPRPADAADIERVVAQLTAELSPQPAAPATLPAVSAPPVAASAGQREPVKTTSSERVAASTKPPTPAKPVAAPKPAPREIAAPTSVVNAASPTTQRNEASVETTHTAASEPAPAPSEWRRDVTPLPGDRPRARYNAVAIRTATEDAVANEPESADGTVARRRASEFAAKGQAAMRARRFGEAADAFKAATAVDPGWFQAQLNYSGAAIEAGRTGEAILAARRAVALQADSLAARFNLALAQRQAGQWREAAMQLEQILSRKPGDERALLTLGNLCAEELAQLERARGYYLKLLEINPGHPQAAAIHTWLRQNPGK